MTDKGTMLTCSNPRCESFSCAKHDKSCITHGKEYTKVTELEELKSVAQAVKAGELSPDDLYQLIDIHYMELIEATKELTQIKQRAIHHSWEDATKEQLIDCLKFIAAVKNALDERNKKFIQALSDIAEHDCVYGDNCPKFVKANHYQCIPCKAREGLE